jgi:hypothetical protein
VSNLVAFTGYAGAGKSTAAQVLIDDGWVRVKFADPLKAMMRAFYKDVGLSDEMIERKIEGNLKEIPCHLLCGKTPRHAMQTLGTEWGRNTIHDNLWVSLAEHKIKAAWGNEVKVVIDDCRYDNEADVIREMGGTIVEVSGRAERSSDHPSEHLPEPSFHLYNRGDIKSLRLNIAYIFTWEDVH